MFVTRFSLGLLLVACSGSLASAGSCPPGHKGNALNKDAPHENMQVDTHVVGTVRLDGPVLHLPNHELRMRRITVEPGGAVMLHSHENRPALAIVTKGELIEFNNECSVPIRHKTGEIIKEGFHVKHWMKNDGPGSAVLTVTDIVDLNGEDTGNFD